MDKTGTPESRDSVVCPYCGLHCDDLSIAVARGGIEVTAKGCAMAKESFAKIAPPQSSRIAGRDAALEDACARAAEILGAARMPLVAGLAADFAGIKAAISLAERIGGTVDHAASDAMFRNVLAVQDKGWVTTTFGEVKNRADLIIIAGTDIVSRFPRFFERFVWNKDSMFEPAPKREIVYVGSGFDTKPGEAPDGRKPDVVACDPNRMGEVFRALRAVYNGRPLQAGEVAGVPVAGLEALANRIKAARYGVIIWAPADMEGPHGELTVQAICELVMDANDTTRLTALPVAGTDNALGAGQVCLWQEGFPLRTSLASGAADYDPNLYSWRRMIESGDADAILWLSAFRPAPLPFETKTPLVVLGAAGSTFKREPEVFICVGTPGIDHAGHVARGDAVPSMPLHKLRDSGLPRTSDVLRLIETKVAAKTGAA